MKMKVEDVKLGMEVLVTDSFQTVNGFTPAGIVGKIRGIMYNDGDMYNDFNECIVLKIGSDNRIYEVPLEGVQPIIDYVPRRGDAILFNYTNGDEIEGIILDFGYRKDDYALFVMIKEQPGYADYSFDCISSKRVLKVVYRYCLHEEETKVC